MKSWKTKSIRQFNGLHNAKPCSILILSVYFTLKNVSHWFSINIKVLKLQNCSWQRIRKVCSFFLFALNTMNWTIPLLNGFEGSRVQCNGIAYKLFDKNILANNLWNFPPSFDIYWIQANIGHITLICLVQKKFVQLHDAVQEQEIAKPTSAQQVTEFSNINIYFTLAQYALNTHTHTHSHAKCEINCDGCVVLKVCT